jgi:hypothetical protein
MIVGGLSLRSGGKTSPPSQRWMPGASRPPAVEAKSQEPLDAILHVDRLLAEARRILSRADGPRAPVWVGRAGRRIADVVMSAALEGQARPEESLVFQP